MNPEHPHIPEPLPSPEKVSTSVTPEQLIAIQGKEIIVQRNIIQELSEINSTLAKRIQELSLLRQKRLGTMRQMKTLSDFLNQNESPKTQKNV